MAQHLIQSETLTAIADAIRSKTGGTEALLPGRFPDEIAGIVTEGSGVLQTLTVINNGTYLPDDGVDGFSSVTVNIPQGSSDDLCYVTFMDGDTVLYVKPVAHGDNCADIISRGLIDTPTRESDDTHTYTFIGWGTADGGEVDETPLQAVTENRTVYAIYHVLTTLATGSRDAVYWKLTDDGVCRVWGEGAGPTGSIFGFSAWMSNGTDYKDSVTTLIFEEGITSLGDWCCLRCTNISSVSLPSTLTAIGMSAFYGCTALKSITLPDSLVSIGNQAFLECSGLSTLTIPAAVTSIGQCSIDDSGVSLVYFEVTSGWWYASSASATSGTAVASGYMASPSTACNYLKNTYNNKYWFRS